MHKIRKLPKGAKSLAATAAAIGALAIANHLVARRTERRHPPGGAFLVVDGVRLHYTDRGNGTPVVAIHGNVVTGADWDTSGVTERLLANHHRVIIFDRPGFGHSDRPPGVVWTASRQADLIHKALVQLGVERPVVVGHSWGTIVALALATRHHNAVSGLVLLSGYYFWSLRPDVLPISLGALPGLGDLLRYTVSPLLGRLLMPLLKWQMFAPLTVPPRFRAEYAADMALRPTQIRATSEDGALMIQGALALREHYRTLNLPVAIIVGDRDRVVRTRQSTDLADKIPGSTLHIVPGAGHMVHHADPALVVRAIDSAASRPGHATSISKPDQHAHADSAAFAAA